MPLKPLNEQRHLRELKRGIVHAKDIASYNKTLCGEVVSRDNPVSEGDRIECLACALIIQSKEERRKK